MPPSVSVIMAVYNGERHVREAVDSIVAQSLGNPAAQPCFSPRFPWRPER
jgi:glycosyltransferase involved in cell wall biosynthesis